MSMKASLQRELQSVFGLADEDFAYQNTDLYVVYSKPVWDWLKSNMNFPQNLTTFTSLVGSGWNGAGKLCIDIPFEGHWPNFEGHQKQ